MSSPKTSPAASSVAARRRPRLLLLGVPVGTPQVIAGILLLCFFAQGLWLISRSRLSTLEVNAVMQGLRLWHGAQTPADSARPPLPALLGAAPVLRDYSQGPAAALPGTVYYPPEWRWLVRLPFLLVGVLLGSSLWYVSRRLAGNTGGYIALALYAFSPEMISRAASVGPSILAAWGSFGAVFTAIAVAHTLYAPREVVLWNWRRILLLGLSFGIAGGSLIAVLAVVIPAALLFLLYLAPQRRAAAVTIFLAGVLVGALLLCCVYEFRLAAPLGSFAHAGGLGFSPELFTRGMVWSFVQFFFLRMPGVLVLLLIALLVYAGWKRTRFFGTTAPLLMFAVLMVAGIALPHFAGLNFFPIAVPFAFVFIAGVFADLLESDFRGIIIGLLAGVLLAHAGFSISGLMRR